MKRKAAAVLLSGFLGYTAVYIFVYLARAFRVDRPADLPVVAIYHGDNFTRTLLVVALFLVGEVFAVYLALAARRPRAVQVRPDVFAWLQAREELTGEPADRLADRAIVLYRTRLEGGAEGDLPSASRAALLGR